MYNDFVIVGPPGDPAVARGLQDAGKAFAIIGGVSIIVATDEFQTIAHLCNDHLSPESGVLNPQPVELENGECKIIPYA
jgi:hypothetical protein